MNPVIAAPLAYGLLAMIGGVMGYLKVKSKMSIISGLVSGLLLVFSAIVQLQGHQWGLTLASVVAAALVIIFAVRLVKTRKFMPAGLMIIAGVLSLGVMLYPLVQL
ncbi:TMEM14 family protein [Lyngbya aestuarii]|uniref:TMEM14 family protein n=1 Tax=Lyngbya aestuarii TaxID=118322 RepID=UPI00403DFEE0